MFVLEQKTHFSIYQQQANTNMCECERSLIKNKHEKHTHTEVPKLNKTSNRKAMTMARQRKKRLDYMSQRAEINKFSAIVVVVVILY